MLKTAQKMSLWNLLFSFEGFISTIVLCYLAYKILTWNHDYFAKRNIPYIKPIPILGNAAPIVFRRSSFSDYIVEVYRAFEEHKFVGLFQSSKPFIMIRDPHVLKQIMVKDFDHFTDHVNFMTEEADPLFDANLFFRKGYKWKHMRNILSPAFTSSKMRAMYSLMIECGHQLSDYLQTRLKESGNEIIPVEMKDIFTKYTSNVIATCAFGIACNSLKNDKDKFFTTGIDITNFSGLRQFRFFGFILFPKIMQFLNIRFLNKKGSDFLFSMVKETLRVREEKGIVRPDMIHLLMKARKGELKDDEEETNNSNSTETNVKTDENLLSDLDITGQAMVFFFAGFETASTTLCFTSTLLAMHPEEQKKLHNEIDQTLEENGGKITYEALHAMKYLDMVVSESLRLYPPNPFADRECTKPYTIPASEGSPEVTLKLKDTIWIPIVGIHRDPKYFQDPENFNPERFSEKNKHNIKPFTYIPFGAGPRMCIGNRFALMEIKIALVSLLSKFSFEIIDRSPIPIKLTKKAFNMTVDGGFWIGLKPRL